MISTTFPTSALRQQGRLQPVLPGVEIMAAPQAEAVVRAADVVITATSARAPILRGDWLRPGQHITAVGADDPTKSELDGAALTRSRVFVDEIAATLANGDVRAAIDSGAYSPDQIAGELGDVLAGHMLGRRSDRDITNEPGYFSLHLSKHQSPRSKDPLRDLSQTIQGQALLHAF